MVCTANVPCVLHEDYVRTYVEPLYEREIIHPLQALPRQEWSDDALGLVKDEIATRARSVHRFNPSHYERARKLVARGCDWPIVKMLALFADFWKVATQRDPAITHHAMDIFLSAKRQGELPPMLQLVMAALVREHGQRRFYYRENANALERFVCSREWSRDELRPLWDILAECNMLGDENYLRVLVELDCPVVKDGWLREMLEGEIAYRTAWSFRGSGWAYTVTEEGWEKYHTYIEKAKRHFEKAYKMRPDIPTSAVMMINCNRGDAEQCRQWFDRAIAIEHDLWAAYRSYVFTIRPRWGGSTEQLRAFANECFARGRKCPSMALEGSLAINVLADEMDKDWASVYDEHVYTNMCAMTELYRGQKFHPDIMLRNASHLLLLPAYVRGDFERLSDCAKNDYGGWPRKPTDAIFGIRSPVSSNIKNISLAFAGNGREDLIAAEKVKRAGRLKDAREQFRSFYNARIGSTNENESVLGMEYAAGEVVRLNYGLFPTEKTAYSIMPDVLKKLTRWSFWRCWDESWTIEPDGSWVIRNRPGPLEATWPIVPDECTLVLEVEKTVPGWKSGFVVLLDGWESSGVALDLLENSNKAQWCTFVSPYVYRSMKREGEKVDLGGEGRQMFKLSLGLSRNQTDVSIDGVNFPSLTRKSNVIQNRRMPVVIGENIRIKSMKVECLPPPKKGDADEI